MHFLCLHGLGTNSHVLETQTAAIRFEMSQHHTYDFVEGCESASMAPEIKGYFASSDVYFNYYNLSAESVSRALTQLDQYIKEEGPFDGVMAFSQGAALISTYLIKLLQAQPGASLPFRFAIFLSGGRPLKVESGDLELLEGSTTQAAITLPTANIWGCNDELYGKDAEVLASFCDPTQREVYIHGGGHEVPGVRAKDDVQRCIGVIRRTIEKASIES